VEKRIIYFTFTFIFTFTWPFFTLGMDSDAAGRHILVDAAPPVHNDSS
jgi:hypothetical protein